MQWQSVFNTSWYNYMAVDTSATELYFHIHQNSHRPRTSSDPWLKHSLQTHDSMNVLIWRGSCWWWCRVQQEDAQAEKKASKPWSCFHPDLHPGLSTWGPGPCKEKHMSGRGCGFKDEQLPAAGDFIMIPILIAGPPPVCGTSTVTSPHP